MIFDGNGGTANWIIVRESTNDTVYSETAISIQTEQLIPDWGLSVEVLEQVNPGTPEAVDGGIIGANVEFVDPTDRWLSGIEDLDGSSAFNWIRSGTVEEPAGYTDYVGVDDDQHFEGILDGTWAPYRLVSRNTVTDDSPDGSGPAWDFVASQAQAQLRLLPSVDVIFTSDKSKWTRVPVVEASDDAALAVGGAEKFNLRESPSVDKDGNPDGTGNGWGWFPGYAVDMETGMRLNMMFAEDSWLVGENGADMLWNPTSRPFISLPGSFQITFGGKHFTYVMGTAYQGDNEQDNPYYSLFNDPTSLNKRNIYRDITWVTIPMLTEGEELLSTDARVSIRVTREYENFTTTDAPNSGDPMYGFNTGDIATITNDLTTAENALSTVRVVPNPYYAYSAYEQNQLDNRVKITNLPERCTVSIFTVNGTLINRFEKDSPLTFLEWDLRNAFQIPISSGVYIIHVDAPGIGDTFVKWFGAMRPIDLDTF
jgi:hypothetical protein